MLVTCYYDIYGKPERFFEYASLFYDIGISGLPIVLFVDPSMVYKFRIFPSTVHIVGLPLEDVALYQLAMTYTGELPSKRTPSKDTKAFFALMNSKIEFVQRAAALFPSETFMWIDFGICKIFKNIAQIIITLGELEQRTFTKMHLPGCWAFGRSMSVDQITWRFCGGFFVIPSTFIDTFYNHSRAVLRDFCTMKQYKLTWETNVWTVIEMCAERENMVWYSADHNDTMILNC